MCAVTTLCKGRRASWSTHNALTLDLAFFPTNSSRQPLATSKHSCTSPQTTYGAISKSRGSMQFCFCPLKGLTGSCCYFQLGMRLSQCLQVKYIKWSTRANPCTYGDLLFNDTGISGFPETYFQKDTSTPKHAKQTALSFLELSAMHGNALILSTQLFPQWFCAELLYRQNKCALRSSVLSRLGNFTNCWTVKLYDYDHISLKAWMIFTVWTAAGTFPKKDNHTIYKAALNLLQITKTLREAPLER